MPERRSNSKHNTVHRARQTDRQGTRARAKCFPSINKAFEEGKQDMTRIIAVAAVLGATFVSAGCTSNEKTFGGAAVGGVGGAVVGNAIGGTGGAVIGGVGGAVAGGAIGRNL
jgi:hypothetical protein